MSSRRARPCLAGATTAFASSVVIRRPRDAHIIGVTDVLVARVARWAGTVGRSCPGHTVDATIREGAAHIAWLTGVGGLLTRCHAYAAATAAARVRPLARSRLRTLVGHAGRGSWRWGAGGADAAGGIADACFADAATRAAARNIVEIALLFADRDVCLVNTQVALACVWSCAGDVEDRF